MPIAAGLLLLAGSLTAIPPPLEILAPTDGSLVRSPTVTLVVRPSSAALEVVLNGEAVAPFRQHEGYRDHAHGSLELRPGENLLTVSLEDEQRMVRVELRPYYSTFAPLRGNASFRKQERRSIAVRPGVGEWGIFHNHEREASCLPCHALAVDQATRKPRTRDDSICSSCHRSKLETAFVHGPVGAFTCLACHREQPPESAPKYFVADQGPELCNACHETKRDLSNHRFVHGPLAVGQCKVCHDPHGSPFRLQLHSEKKQLCYSCHQELRRTLETSSAIRHAVIEEKGCAVCHEPHASQLPLQLRRPLNELCLDCHEKQLGARFGERAHPVTGHPAGGVDDPSRPGEILTCISCHNPHASTARGLLRAPGYLELCLQCHDK